MALNRYKNIMTSGPIPLFAHVGVVTKPCPTDVQACQVVRLLTLISYNRAGNMQNLEKLLEENELVQITPEGYSMYPLVVPGRDQVILTKVNRERIRRGDVLLYRRPSGILVLHRVWKVRGDGIYMVGDNQDVTEGPLPRALFLGIVVTFIRKGKRFSARNPVYVCFSGLWLFMRPLRLPIMRPLAAIKRRLRGRKGPTGKGN